MMEIKTNILKLTGASDIIKEQPIQILWSGYGEIKKVFLNGGKYPSIIVKHIQLPEEGGHPKGWNTARSHKRKLKSYEVERNWYQNYADLTNKNCRVPACYDSLQEDSELMIIMEDMDASGYDLRIHHERVSLKQTTLCLSWLASFHATFLGRNPNGLWSTGTYWHLETRPDELKKMQNLALQRAAHDIDETLKNAKYQTLVHGDTKLANFCFSKDDNSVAAVDFQYVGKGCGIKDVAYFISSCFDAKTCDKYEEKLLKHYFNQLEIALDKSIDYQELKEEWSLLYKYAWADFYRFLDGWNTGHWKMHDYSKKLTQEVLSELK